MMWTHHFSAARKYADLVRVRVLPGNVTDVGLYPPHLVEPCPAVEFIQEQNLFATLDHAVASKHVEY